MDEKTREMLASHKKDFARMKRKADIKYFMSCGLLGIVAGVALTKAFSAGEEYGRADVGELLVDHTMGYLDGTGEGEA